MIRVLTISILMAAAAGMALADGLDAVTGKALFEREWIAAPASTDAADGLGPLFNGKSCNSCHKDGGAARFFSLDGKLTARGLVVRLASPDGGPHRRFGTQLQDRAVAGLAAEGKVQAEFQGSSLVVKAEFSDGEGKDVLEEARIAPSLRGRGRLEDIQDSAIMGLADPDDRDGDGVSGKARLVKGADGTWKLGRFGNKATAANLDMQVADAAAIDLGLSSKLRPSPHGDCTLEQRACRAMATGQSAGFEGEEMSRQMISLIAGFVRSLEGPDRKPAAAGLDLFAATGCSACHRPEMPSRSGKPLTVFTDLLLHDLGSEAAGKIPDQGFSPSEWRTAPLIDLDPMDGKRRYLHDGRAATVEQAIEMHGGEAQASRRAFQRLDSDDKKRLIEFLTGL